MKQGLILVDIQNDYFSGGTMELAAMDTAALNCQKLLNSFRAEEKPVFHIQHMATREGATFFVPDTKGCDIHESVKPLDDEPVVVKHFPNSFRETRLHAMLQKEGIEEVVICGAMSHMCIDSTARAAFDLGYKCKIIADACATRDLKFNGYNVKAVDVQASFMAALGVPFAEILFTEKYLSSAH